MNATRIPTLACFLSLLTLLLTHSSVASADNPLTGYTAVQFDSLARQLGRELSKVTTEEVGKRKRERREFQRRTYQNTLPEVLRGDGLGSMLMYVRSSLHLQLSLPHDNLYIYQPMDSLILFVPVVFTFEDGTELTFEMKKVKLTLKEDWKFPVDPWKRD